MSAIRSRTLLSRAAQLRRHSATAPAPLAVAYRRRAAELEMEAALIAPHACPALPGAAA